MNSNINPQTIVKPFLQEGERLRWCAAPETIGVFNATIDLVSSVFAGFAFFGVIIVGAVGYFHGSKIDAFFLLGGTTMVAAGWLGPRWLFKQVSNQIASNDYVCALTDRRVLHIRAANVHRDRVGCKSGNRIVECAVNEAATITQEMSLEAVHKITVLKLAGMTMITFQGETEESKVMLQCQGNGADVTGLLPSRLLDRIEHTSNNSSISDAR